MNFVESSDELHLENPADSAELWVRMKKMHIRTAPLVFWKPEELSGKSNMSTLLRLRLLDEQLFGKHEFMEEYWPWRTMQFVRRTGDIRLRDSTGYALAPAIIRLRQPSLAEAAVANRGPLFSNAVTPCRASTNLFDPDLGL